MSWGGGWGQGRGERRGIGGQGVSGVIMAERREGHLRWCQSRGGKGGGGEGGWRVLG